MIKILLVDDDPEMTTVIEDMLTRGRPTAFEIVKVHSGADGVEAVRDHDPDVVVLDLMMPGVSGWEALRQIRVFSQVPILVFSAVIDPDLVMEALDEGANDYLVKPVPGSVLVSRINRLLRL